MLELLAMILPGKLTQSVASHVARGLAPEKYQPLQGCDVCKIFRGQAPSLQQHQDNLPEITRLKV